MPVAAARAIVLRAAERERLKKMACGHKTEHRHDVHYAEDVASGEAFCLVQGSERELMANALRQIESRLATWSQPGLLNAVEAGATPEEMVQALFRLGLGAPIALDDTHLGSLSVEVRRRD
ncbi:hypothetical protein ABZ897_06790 [Nonomuraea sp. NPDC046802]|uniref:hypothetical protein n=1 Tax=Nonomuraea sp. NPDC046802 TaxID=3154919 RepID=UPI0033D7C3C6